MTKKERITAFCQLGEYLRNLSSGEREQLALEAENENRWFTRGNVETALEGITSWLTERELTSWTAPYKLTPTAPQTVGIAMAGNIPLVGFHDLLSVLISGHYAQVKLSSKDSTLPAFLINALLQIEPRLRAGIQLTERLQSISAAIATGSNNTSRYFEYYLRNIPHIIRRNRTSCAVLTGSENDQQLTALGSDVFTYFGLGCRNVSKVYVPEHYDFSKILDLWSVYSSVGTHNKYVNNYDYQKSILLVNQIPFLDNGFVLLQESTQLASPTSVVYFEYYEHLPQVEKRIAQYAGQIQCVVSGNPKGVPFGKAQQPSLWDYPDDINTLEFLSGL